MNDSIFLCARPSLYNFLQKLTWALQTGSHKKKVFFYQPVLFDYLRQNLAFAFRSNQNSRSLHAGH